MYWNVATGGSISIFFTPAAVSLDSLRPPYLTVSIWKKLDDVAGHTLRWPVEESIGAASLCTSESECQVAESAVVTIGPIAADSVLFGRIELGFKDRPTVTGSFRAPLRPRRYLCGRHGADFAPHWSRPTTPDEPDAIEDQPVDSAPLRTREPAPILET